MAAFKAHVKTVDMSEEMEADAIAIATAAIMEHSVEKDMASYVRRKHAAEPLPTPVLTRAFAFGRSSASLTRSTGQPQHLTEPHTKEHIPVGICFACAPPHLSHHQLTDSRRCASQSDMARDHRHQLRLARSARHQASPRVGVARQKRLRPHTPYRRYPGATGPTGHAPQATGCSADQMPNATRDTQTRPLAIPIRPRDGLVRDERGPTSVVVCMAAPTCPRALGLPLGCVLGSPTHVADACLLSPAGTSFTSTWGRRRY